MIKSKRILTWAMLAAAWIALPVAASAQEEADPNAPETPTNPGNNDEP